MKIKEEAKKNISNAIANIALELDKSPLTIYRWIYQTPHLLRKKNNLKAIKKFTGLTENEIFDKTDIK